MGSMLELGVVVKAHGVRGAVKVQLYNPASTALAEVHRVLLADGAEEARPVEVRLLGVSGGAALLELDGVTDREAAEALRGARLLIERQALPPLADGEYYYEDLLGCRAETEDGQPLGEVAAVFSAGASDVLVLRDGETERMVPLVDEWVTTVDLEDRRIQVRGAEQFEPTRVTGQTDRRR